MAKQYQVPYLRVRVARSPMNIQVVEVLAHEVFILSSMFDDVSVVGRALDTKREQQYQVVDAQREYQRMINKYGSNPDTEKSRAEEVFGPPFGKGWTGALDIDLEEMLGEDVPEPPAAQDAQSGDQGPDKIGLLAEHVIAMRTADPHHENDGWWTGGGKPEVSHLKQELKKAGHDLPVSAKDRDAAVARANEQAASGDQAINVQAVMARLDDINVTYDPDDTPTNLVNQLRQETISQIEVLGGEVDEDSDTLEGMSAKLDQLRQEHEAG